MVCRLLYINELIKLKENTIAQPYHPNAAILCMSLPVCTGSQVFI